MSHIKAEPKTISPIQVVEFHHDHFKQTRDIQWKLNVALWTLLVGGIALGVTKQPQFNPWLAGVACIACVLVHAISACLQQESLNYDKVRWNYYLPEIPKEVAGETAGASSRVTKWAIALNGNSIMWVVIQSAITFVLAVLTFSSLTGIGMGPS